MSLAIKPQLDTGTAKRHKPQITGHSDPRNKQSRKPYKPFAFLEATVRSHFLRIIRGTTGKVYAGLYEDHKTLQMERLNSLKLWKYGRI